ncbi:MAG: hypothetical protein V1872_04865 [bacterium]
MGKMRSLAEEKISEIIKNPEFTKEKATPKNEDTQDTPSALRPSAERVNLTQPPESRIKLNFRSNPQKKVSEEQIQPKDHPKQNKLLSLKNFLNKGSNIKITSLSNKLSIKIINKILFLVVIIIFLLLSLDFYKSSTKLDKQFNLLEWEKPPIFKEPEDIMDKVFPPLNNYLAILKNKNIFSLPFTEEKEEVKEINPITESTIKELKMVGIIWSKKPEAMIEYSKNSRTYFLSKGDAFLNYRVKNIFRNSVLLSTKDGRTFSLK